MLYISHSTCTAAQRIISLKHDKKLELSCGPESTMLARVEGELLEDNITELILQPLIDDLEVKLHVHDDSKGTWTVNIHSNYSTDLLATTLPMAAVILCILMCLCAVGCKMGGMRRRLKLSKKQRLELQNVVLNSGTGVEREEKMEQASPEGQPLESHMGLQSSCDIQTQSQDMPLNSPAGTSFTCDNQQPHTPAGNDSDLLTVPHPQGDPPHTIPHDQESFDGKSPVSWGEHLPTSTPGDPTQVDLDKEGYVTAYSFGHRCAINWGPQPKILPPRNIRRMQVGSSHSLPYYKTGGFASCHLDSIPETGDGGYTRPLRRQLSYEWDDKGLRSFDPNIAQLSSTPTGTYREDARWDPSENYAFVLDEENAQEDPMSLSAVHTYENVGLK
jgi:hypothetical protein